MASTDWNPTANRADSFGFKGRTITPGATDLDPIAKAVVMLSEGDITVVPVNNTNGATLAFAGLPAGYVVPFFVRRVTACSGTCATID